MGIGQMAIILVIDDYAESLDALANIIRNWGQEVITARCEEDACQYCERYAALDVLIVDVKLRGSRSGAEVARELIAFYPDVGVIFVSIPAPSGEPDSRQFLPRRRFDGICVCHSGIALEP